MPIHPAQLIHSWNLALDSIDHGINIYDIVNGNKKPPVRKFVKGNGRTVLGSNTWCLLYTHTGSHCPDRCKVREIIFAEVLIIGMEIIACSGDTGVFCSWPKRARNSTYNFSSIAPWD